MSAPERLRAQQFQLAAHIRDPERQPPPPGIEERRLAIYRDLFFNSLLGLLSGNFPVLSRLLGETAWPALARDFYREYRCSTPLFTELPREFIHYLQQRQAEGRADPPWQAELAHYEWVELALDLEEAAPAPHDPAGDLLGGVPVLSPVAWPLAYAWPVHRLSPDFLPAEAPATPTFLLVLRDAGLQVRFHEISALTFRLLQRLDEAPELSGREQLRALAAEAGAADATSFEQQGRGMLERLREQGALLGIRPD
ncbi:MAG TPA: putative DNA-binding domain-containing protein [Arenimonas sp.]|nr:putative DNA-binding domain-containing protein [Arenimonas sp.]